MAAPIKMDIAALPSTPAAGVIVHGATSKLLYAWKNEDGTTFTLPLSNVGTIVLHKLDATTAPTANEDSGDGYAVGSIWCDVTADEAYVCVDATSTAAVWRKLLHTASSIATSQLTGTLDDARVAESNVTQHEAALTLATSQVTSGTFADARISESSVTQHEAALTVDGTQLDYTYVTESTTTRTLTDADHGKIIWCTNASGCTVTLGTGRRADFYCTLVQMGAAQVTLTPSSTTLRVIATFASTVKTKEQYAEMHLRHSPTTDTYKVTGELEAA